MHISHTFTRHEPDHVLLTTSISTGKMAMSRTRAIINGLLSDSRAINALMDSLESDILRRMGIYDNR